MVARHPNRKGELEYCNGGFRLYCRMRGYVTKTGGYSSKPGKAQVYRGAGDAIRHAAVLGFAILRWG